ncbi:CBR-PGP-3 protein [Aphelenchoides fujianensis]|nr:CBR-PGP-3 protein [Aphelenchoides fujianensis]
MAKREETPKIGGVKKRQVEAVEWLQLMRYADGFDWFLLGLGSLFAVLNGFLAPLSLFAFQHLTDTQIIGQKQFDSPDGLDVEWFTQSIVEWAITYFCFGLALFVVGYAQTLCFMKVGDRQAHRMKEAFIRSVLHQDSAWYQTATVGSLSHRLTAGVDRVRDGTGDKLGFIVQAAANLFMGVFVAFYMSWKMATVLLLGAPLVVTSVWGGSSGLKSLIRKEMDASGLAAATAEEVLSGIRTVATFNAQPLELRRYSLHLNEAYRYGIRKASLSSFFTGAFELINFFSMAVAVWMGSNLVISGAITPGTVFSVYWAVICGTIRLGKAIPYLSVIMKARIAAAELFEIIDRKPALDSASREGARPDGVEPSLKFANIRFSYPSRPDVPVLKGVSFEVNAGETIALVGSSGSGKSTLVQLLMRFFDPTEGQITFGDIPLEKINVEWLRNQIGLVSQEPCIFSGSVAENLRMGKEDLTEAEMIEACTQANAHEFICKLPEKYETKIGPGGIALSGGQKQRLVIARILARKPRILLLDEATSALDTESERQVQAAIEQASSGRTCITIAHRLSTIRNANRILVFDAGQLVEVGSHDELMERDSRYKQLVLAQQVEKREEKLKQPPSEPPAFRKGAKLRESTRSAASVSTKMSELEQERMELKAEGGAEATFSQIWSFAKEERKFLLPGVLIGALRGHVWPVYALILGHFFHTMSSALAGGDPERLRSAALFDGGVLGALGLTTRLASDAPNVQAAMDTRLGDVLQGLISLLFGLGIGFYFGWKMALIEAANSFVFLALQLVLVEMQKRRAIADADALDEAFQVASESIENVQTIQALTKQNFVYERFCSLSSSALRLTSKRANLQGLLYGLISCVEEVHFGTAYLAGLLLIRWGHATPFTVFQVIESVNMGLMSFYVVTSYIPEYLRARVAAGLMFRMIKREAPIDSMSEGGQKPTISGRVHLKDVDFAYPNARTRPVLSDFSLEIEPGQTIALVGPSGSGKSTTIQLLERFYDVMNGSLTIDGVDIREINLRHLRTAISLVAQDACLFNLTLAQNIAYGMQSASIEQVIAAAKLANIDDFIQSLPQKYDTLIGHRGSQLSGGQKQRISIARAIIRAPRILLLDEATSALDSESERLVQQAIERISETRTCIVVAHRLSTIRNADRIVVVKDGQVVEQGKYEELLERKGLFFRLANKQTT